MLFIRDYMENVTCYPSCIPTVNALVAQVVIGQTTPTPHSRSYMKIMAIGWQDLFQCDLSHRAMGEIKLYDEKSTWNFTGSKPINKYLVTHIICASVEYRSVRCQNLGWLIRLAKKKQELWPTTSTISLHITTRNSWMSWRLDQFDCSVMDRQSYTSRWASTIVSSVHFRDLVW